MLLLVKIKKKKRDIKRFSTVQIHSRSKEERENSVLGILTHNRFKLIEVELEIGRVMGGFLFAQIYILD